MSRKGTNGSPRVGPGFVENPHAAERMEREHAPQVTDADGPAAAETSATTDTVRIPDTARRPTAQRQAGETGHAAMEALPEVRDDKVARAKERLKSGYYNSEAVREKIAGGVDKVIKGMEEL